MPDYAQMARLLDMQAGNVHDATPPLFVPEKYGGGGMGMATGQFNPQYGSPQAESALPREGPGYTPGQDVGQVINLDKMRKQLLEGGMDPMRGGGTFSSKWRDPGQVGQYEAQQGLRPGSLMPVPPRSAEVTKFREPYFKTAPETSQKQAGQASRNQYGLTVHHLRGIMEGRASPGAVRNFNAAWNQLTPDQQTRLLTEMYKE